MEKESAQDTEEGGPVRLKEKQELISLIFENSELILCRSGFKEKALIHCPLQKPLPGLTHSAQVKTSVVLCEMTKHTSLALLLSSTAKTEQRKEHCPDWTNWGSQKSSQRDLLLFCSVDT